MSFLCATPYYLCSLKSYLSISKIKAIHAIVVVKSCNYHAQASHHIRHLLTSEVAQMLTCSLHWLLVVGTFKGQHTPVPACLIRRLQTQNCMCNLQSSVTPLLFLPFFQNWLCQKLTLLNIVSIIQHMLS